MLTLLPIGLNLIAGFLIFSLSRIKINVGRAWLIAAVFSLLNWGTIFALKWFYPLQFVIEEWFPIGETYQRGIFFRLDEISWPLLLALCAVQSAVIITDSSRLDEIPSVSIWAGVFLVYSVGMFAVLTNSIISIILVWALVDIIELFILLRTSTPDQSINEIVVSFGVKILGLFSFILGLLVSYEQNSPLRIGEETNNIGIFILVAVGLRLGVIPFNLPFVSGSPIRRGLGNSIRMVSVTTSVMVLLRMPIGSFDERAQSILFILTSLGILFGAIMWLGSSSELEGRPYWIITMSGLAIYSSMNGSQLSNLTWTLALILSGSVIFLYSSRGQKLTTIPLIAVIGLSGLPFTPSNSGWQGIIIPGQTFENIIITISFIILLLGYIQHATVIDSYLTKKEKWVWITYPIGLVLLIITHWVIFFVSELNWNMQGNIFLSIFTFISPLVFYFLIQKYIRSSDYSRFINVVLFPIGNFVKKVLSFRWLYKLFWSILEILQRIINLFSNILEGQGGIIWVIVFLLMIITLVASGDIA